MTNGIFLTIRTRHIPKVISDPFPFLTPFPFRADTTQGSALSVKPNEEDQRRITGACRSRFVIDKAECASIVSWGDSRERASSNMTEKVTSYPIAPASFG